MDKETRSPVKMSPICRLCGKPARRVVNVLSDHNKLRGLPEKIFRESDIKICAGDGLSKKICQICCNKVEKNAAFRQSCHQSQTKQRLAVLTTAVLVHKGMHTSSSTSKMQVNPTREPLSTRKQLVGEKIYLVKSRTNWECADIFNDSEFWDESIKDKESVQQHTKKGS